MPLPIPARDYLFKALIGTPVVVSALLGDRDDSDPIWDKRPDPERFTLREILGHLADWEPIWQDRISKTLRGDQPFLPSIDEGQLAIEHNYAGSSPTATLRRFSEGRQALVDFLGAIADDKWDLTCDREFVGVLTVQQLAFFALAHDGYHVRQVADWVA
jgi:hypothetical protein